MQKTPKWLIGIDEAGRGPLAGPVAVGVVVVPFDFTWEKVPGVTDSKKLSHKRREEVYARVHALAGQLPIYFSVGQSSAVHIDGYGIVPSIKSAMEEALNTLKQQIGFHEEECYVKLDGALRAPSSYIHQETIIKGDAKEKVIGLASIFAKVTRDRYMEKQARNSAYAEYGFEVHKGYGTKAHCEKIRELGLSKMHRKSFCLRLL